MRGWSSILPDSPGSVPGPPRLAYVAAVPVAVFAFLFRLLTLRSLPNDHYMYLAWAQQLLLGELPERDFVDPGIPLQGVLSAAGQALAPGPATEGTVTITMLALAAAATCIGVAWLTRSTTAGALAALFQIVAQPRLYSFPKILVPAVFLVLALAHARRPRTATLALLALWIVVAFLLRHDLGVYVGVGSVVTVALCCGSARRAAREALRLAGAVLLMLLPYFIYLEWSGSIVEHARGSFEYGKSEVHLFEFDWPVFGFGASQADGLALWDRDDAAAFLFYCSYVLPLLSLLVLLAPEHRGNAATRAVVTGVVAVSAFYAGIILRHPLPARVPDLAAIYAVLGAWCVVALVRVGGGPQPRARLAARWAVRASLAAALLVAVLSIDVLAEVRVQLKEARLLRPPFPLAEQAARAIAGPEWPWRVYWPAGPVPAAIDYLHTCTTPGQRVWLTWQAPEYYFFARRGFGAGHAMLPAPHSYTTERDQELMVARLDRHEVPIVLINESTRSELAAAYPSVDDYLRRQYAPAGELTIRDGSVISIAVRRGLRATDVYGDEGWPCRLMRNSASGGRERRPRTALYRPVHAFQRRRRRSPNALMPRPSPTRLSLRHLQVMPISQMSNPARRASSSASTSKANPSIVTCGNSAAADWALNSL